VPELPEVETVVRELRPLLVGRRIRKIFASRKRLRGSWSLPWSRTLIGRRIHQLRRRGKWIILDLSGDSHLVLHLGMSGRLSVISMPAPVEPHTHLRFTLDRGGHELRFQDIRRFGSAMFFEDRASLDCFFEERKLGPEPFGIDLQYWRQRLGSTNRSIKAVLLDQRVVAGVGNIYADESLFQARLHPARIGRDITMTEAQRLRRAIGDVLQFAISKRGSSIRDFVGGSGLPGEYQLEFRVYGQAGQPCPRCRSPIECIRLAGRATHFCRRCQPPATRRTERLKRNGPDTRTRSDKRMTDERPYDQRIEWPTRKSRRH
jgi:formamidopyrimidine-DNA glycosylase